MKTCHDTICPVALSVRLLGWNHEDYVVVEIEHTHALARLIDVRMGTSTIYSFRELDQLIGDGDLKIAAQPQPRISDKWRFPNDLDRRTYYCNAVDVADARFLLAEPDFERVVQEAAAKVGERPPPAATVMVWWRRWVLNDRADETFSSFRAA